MEGYCVSRAVNSPLNDSPECIVPDEPPPCFAAHTREPGVVAKPAPARVPEAKMTASNRGHATISIRSERECRRLPEV